MNTHQETPVLQSSTDGSSAGWGTDLRMLLVLALPNVASTAAESLMSFVDFAIVSPLGPAAQAAVSSASLVYFSIFGFCLGMMVCVTTVVSQSLGIGRPRDCSAYGWQGIWLSLTFGLLGIVLWPVVPGFYAWVGHEPAVQAMESDYTQIRLLGLGFAGAAVALGHFFNGIHEPRHNAYSVVGTTILNLVLTYGLVQGRLGMPAMGVAGAAVGSVVANLVRVLWLLAVMCSGSIAARYGARQTWPLQWDKMRRLAWVGWPAGVSFMVDITAWAVLMAMIIGQFGTHHLAASATCWRFTDLSFMPAIGIGHAVCTLVGRSIGEGRPDLARRRALLGTLLNMGYMGTMALMFVLFGRELMELFSDVPDVITLGAELLILAALFQLFDAIGITYSNALRGAGDTRWPAVVGGLQVWILMVGGAALTARLMPEWGARGPWIVATLFVIVIGVTFALRWRLGPWERLDVIGRGTEPPVFEVMPTDPLVPEQTASPVEEGCETGSSARSRG